MSAGTIKVYSANDEIIEERHYITFDGAKNIVLNLLEYYKGMEKCIHFCPNVTVSDAEQKEFGKGISSVYGNLKIHDYSKNGIEK